MPDQPANIGRHPPQPDELKENETYARRIESKQTIFLL
jgi:hypothetical protein